MATSKAKDIALGNVKAIKEKPRSGDINSRKKLEKKEILIINGVLILISAIPMVGVVTVPILFVYNFVSGIYNLNKDKEMGIFYLINAFVGLLVGFSVCSFVFSETLGKKL